ncbi:MAG: chemotaxis protein CheD [Candidatus Riflebacteria bacterium]|nr:chemotaxis protein CheD [Candidatus Riflebacteria bacterium]
MPVVYPVGMADLRIARNPDVLAAYGVGSCVIVAMYDPKSRIGGLVHIMLPDSSGIEQEKVNPKKFADTGVPLLFQTLSHAGIFRGSIWAKLVGGAEMFPPNEDFSSTIGQKNVEAARLALEKIGIPIMAVEIGGTSGRSLELKLETGMIRVNILGETVKDI